MVVPLLTPFTTSLEDVGERGVYYLTSAQYPSLQDQEGASVPVQQGVKIDDCGRGAHSVYEMSDPREGKCMKGYREDGTREKVWAHTEEMWDLALKKAI